MENFVFIVGCGHSGTTILNKILSNHPNVFGVNYETYLFQSNEKDMLSKLNELNNKKILNDKKWVCEKTPKHVHFINKMYKYTNNPKIIVVTRDGRDVVASLKKRFGACKIGVNRWIHDNNAWLNHKNIKEFHVIKYEDFVHDPSTEIRKICDFLGEQYYDDLLNYPTKQIELGEDFYNKLIDTGRHDLLRLHQINKPIYDGTKRYEKDLTESEINNLMSNNGFITMMNKLGYIL